MVFKVVNGTDLDLFNITDHYGIENDTVIVLALNSNKISTYAGDDIIDASKASQSSFISEFLAGFGNDRVYGSVGKDWVYDGGGSDIVNLGQGDDRIFVDTGNDVYYGGTGSDTADFRYVNVSGGVSGADANTAGVVFDLAKTTAQNLGELGNDQFFGFENARGSDGTDKLLGSSAANTLEGAAGNDVLDGRAGNDTLGGGEGIDILIGGAGRDTLDIVDLINTRDFVRFNSTSDSGLDSTSWDTITGFDKGTANSADRIDLAIIDADTAATGNQAFAFRGSAGFSSAGGEVRYVVSGGNTVVYVDTDSDAAAEMAFQVNGVTGLAAGDFLL